MKTRLILYALILCCLSGTMVCAQEVGISIGYGQYHMQDLKRLNSEFLTFPVYNIPIKQVNNFPGFVTFSGRFSTPLTTSFEMGAELSVNSTGSRIAYSDYSGSMKIDQKVHGVSLAVVPAVLVTKESKTRVTLELKSGICKSFLTLSTLLVVNEEASRVAVRFNSINFFLEPGLRVGRTIVNNNLRLAINVGYNMSVLRGKLYLEDDRDMYLLAWGEEAKANWSGMRADLSISYVLKRLK